MISYGLHVGFRKNTNISYKHFPEKWQDIIRTIIVDLPDYTDQDIDKQFTIHARYSGILADHCDKVKTYCLGCIYYQCFVARIIYMFTE